MMICVWSWDLLSSKLDIIVDLLIGGCCGLRLKYLVNVGDYLMMIGIDRWVMR